jgi:hypothetical protein
VSDRGGILIGIEIGFFFEEMASVLKITVILNLYLNFDCFVAPSNGIDQFLSTL